jgi:hypothetical protein
MLLLGVILPLRELSADAVEEYVAKAALTFNFARYTEWSSAAVAASPDVLRACVVGNNALLRAFHGINGRRVGERQIRVSALRKLDQPRGCDLIFINIRDRSKISLLLEHARNLPILTIGEIGGFCDYGGIINLYRAGNKLRFEINLTAANQAKLEISSRLLRLAKIVE